MKSGVGRSPSPNHSGTMSGSPKLGADTSPIFDIGSAVIAGLTPCGRPGIGAGLETELLFDKGTSGRTAGGRTLAGSAMSLQMSFLQGSAESGGHVDGKPPPAVMPRPVPGIHVFVLRKKESERSWMGGASPAMKEGGGGASAALALQARAATGGAEGRW